VQPEESVREIDRLDEDVVLHTSNVENDAYDKRVRDKRRVRRPAHLNLYVCSIYVRNGVLQRTEAMDWPKGLKRECNVCAVVCDSTESYNGHRHVEYRRECAPTAVTGSRPTTTSTADALEGTGAVAPARHKNQRPPSGSAHRERTTKIVKRCSTSEKPRRIPRRVLSDSDTETEAVAPAELQSAAVGASISAASVNVA